MPKPQMGPQESGIELSIRGTDQVFTWHITVNGDIVAANQSLSPAESQAIRDFSQRFNSIFEDHARREEVPSEQLTALGDVLFQTWLADTWDKIKEKVQPGTNCLLVIASDVPDILNLPWELLRLGSDFLGFDPKFSIRRLPWADRHLAAFLGTLPPRPLRILFLACAPQDQAELEYEREESSLLQAMGKAGGEIFFDSGDMGTFEELRQRINDFQPHVVHLTGHAIVGRKCPKCENLSEPSAQVCLDQSCAAPIHAVPPLGYFAFENDEGRTDLRSSVEIRQELFAGSGVQCAFISGCQAGKAPPVAALGGVCQGLVGDEVPLALGWAASIADSLATRFAETFYNTLASGRTIDRALVQARQAIRKECDRARDPSWTLPVLYSSTTQGLIFDPAPARPAAAPTRSPMVQAPLPGMIEGYAEKFVNRRRELQRLLPGLRDGSIQFLIITGLGGTGKSTLATRLARKLETNAFTPIAVPSSRGSPVSAVRLMQACGDAFLAANLRQPYETLRDPGISVNDRLHFIVAVLNKNRFVLVLDNFEENLDESTHRILNREIQEFYTYLQTNLAGGSRCLVTSRYRPV